MSKKLFSPKSPFAEILVNFPLSILPINLKFFRFSDKGAIILVKSISISLLIWKNTLFEFKIVTRLYYSLSLLVSTSLN